MKRADDTDLTQTSRSLPEGAHTDFVDDMSYADFLEIDKLLSIQNPLDGHHDVPLFVIIHQTSELWLKLVLHELHAARSDLQVAQYDLPLKGLARVKRIFEQLISSWSVLSTLTPSDYAGFRDQLGKSSGFQSWQYRELEFLMGNRNPALVRPHQHRSDIVDRLNEELSRRSLYDVVIALLADAGFKINRAVLERDTANAYRADESVQAAWQKVYANADEHWQLYDLGEKLVDMEDMFQSWRFRHMITVSRIIGEKRGTGGTSGVGYLKRALDYRFFPELWDVRTRI